MPRIVISYRRADSEAITGRIFDRLVGHYGRDSVFRDVDSIPLGVDFRDHIGAVLDESNIVLVVVGPRWLGGSGAQGRLNVPTDPVRIEVETALSKGIPVIPILVNRKGMPKVEQLPDSLKDFAYRSGQKVDTGSDFDYHVDRLIRAMDKLLAANSQRVIEARGIAPELELGTSLSQPFLSGTLPTAPASHRTSAPAGDVPPVLLAEVTEDLESERLEMRRSLEGHGLQVLPKASYPLGRSEFEAAIDADLAHCSLLFSCSGQAPENSPVTHQMATVGCSLNARCDVPVASYNGAARNWTPQSSIFLAIVIC